MRVQKSIVTYQSERTVKMLKTRNSGAVVSDLLKLLDEYETMTPDEIKNKLNEIKTTTVLAKYKK